VYPFIVRVASVAEITLQISARILNCPPIFPTIPRCTVTIKGIKNLKLCDCTSAVTLFREAEVNQLAIKDKIADFDGN
jgi:hypothetical protein